MINLADYQLNALSNMKNGCILCGGVGSGKSRTALAYYYICQGCNINDFGAALKKAPLKKLIIITTARKRDTLEWEKELAVFLMSTNKEKNVYGNDIVVDSWNNIKKYIDIKDAFFIFDEQRLIGSGVWVKTFLKIAKNNEWILLSATPGDNWSDYIPVFIANGFYKNRTEFLCAHAVFNRYSKFRKIDKYINTGRLNALRRKILVNMKYQRNTTSVHKDILVEYDRTLYSSVIKKGFNPETNAPFRSAAELCYYLRKIVNSSEERYLQVKKIAMESNKVIVFYNYNYELKLLKDISLPGFKVAEWNGHKHEPIPETDKWIYLVQYAAGAEGWNCIETDSMIFLSQNYSYKIMVQAAGRIDRMNTPYNNLFYYFIKTNSTIDKGIDAALRQKKQFNEESFAGGLLCNKDVS